MAHYYLKIGFEYVTIEAEEPHITCELTDGAYTEGHIIARYAGPYAQRKHCPRGQWEKEGRVDFETCKEMWDEVFDDDSECWTLQGKLARRRAEVLVELHWPVIQKVAQALLERKRLTHAEVMEVISNHE